MFGVHKMCTNKNRAKFKWIINMIKDDTPDAFGTVRWLDY